MASVIETFLMCDGCHQNFGVDDRWRNVAKQRKVAAADGWIYSGNKDYCPDCRPKRIDGQNHSGRKRSKQLKK